MGQKYAAHDATGNIIAFYDSDHSPLPEGKTAIPITDEEWQAALSSQRHTVDIENEKLVPPSEATLFAVAKDDQKALLDYAYANVVLQDITFKTEGGVSKKYQADANSVATLNQAAQVYTIVGKTPAGYYWKSSDNTPVPFTLNDLTNLVAAIADRNWIAFRNLTALKSSVDKTKTLEDVQKVIWK